MMNTGSHALICRQLELPICHISRALPVLSQIQGAVSAAEFLSHVEALAQYLPEGEHAINLCGNRYLFMVSMCAVILRRQTNLFPPNKNLTTQISLSERYPNTFVIHDGTEVAEGVSEFSFESLPTGAFERKSFNSEVPLIPLDHLAAISFTSGSTGQSKPNDKDWRCLTTGVRINKQYMLGPALDQSQVVTTVPGQHMWGLETTVMQAMMSNVCITDTSPLYPKDIQALLQQLSSPRILVSAPVHLRAMVMSGLSFPQVARVLCATAPLDVASAKNVEECFGGELIEIYGCSEVGSMAFRRTADEGDWHLFDGIQMTQEGEATIASADHVPDRVEMQDLITMSASNRFQLNGRQSDLIEIAGKRGSLKELNEILQKVDGLKDGVVFLPEQKRKVPRLVALVVMQEGKDKNIVADHFRKHLDNAFVPRPIIQVERLPREENGKLPLKIVTEFYAAITA